MRKRFGFILCAAILTVGGMTVYAASGRMTGRECPAQCRETVQPECETRCEESVQAECPTQCWNNGMTECETSCPNNGTGEGDGMGYHHNSHGNGVHDGSGIHSGADQGNGQRHGRGYNERNRKE